MCFQFIYFIVVLFNIVFDEASVVCYSIFSTTTKCNLQLGFFAKQISSNFNNTSDLNSNFILQFHLRIPVQD
jgi:hypothetical protein